MAEKLLVEQADAGRSFLAEFHQHFPVSQSFWIKPEDGDWRMYIVSDKGADENLRAAYKKVIDLLPFGGDLTSEQVKLIGSNHPLAQAAARVQQLLDPRLPHNYTAGFFGGMFVSGVYVYEIPTGVPGWATSRMATTP